MGPNRYTPPFTTNDQTADGHIPNVDLSPCTFIEEIKFLVGMVSVAKHPLKTIREALESVASRCVGVITLDLNTTDTGDASNQELLQYFQRLDFNLCWIASARRGGKQTVVKLSVNDPFVLGSCLRRFKTHGKLILGTRSVGPSGFLGDVEWFEK